MFLYYQDTDDQKAKWLSCPDQERYRRELKEKQAPMITVLSVSQLIERDQFPSPSELKYKGPLYFDIDNEDIRVSIDSAQKLAEKLVSVGVDPRDLEIWLSGKKGLHMTLSAKIFSHGRAVTALPMIYQEIAHEFMVEGLDMMVYSAKRGRMWRQPNIQRANGKYKVPITYSELESLNPESYDQLCSSPREIHKDGQETTCNQLAAKFETAKRVVQKRIRMLETEESFTEDDIKDVSDESGCIQNLITKGDRVGSNFNQAAMQLAAYIKLKYERSDSEQWMPLVRTMAENVKSATYKSKPERIQHIKGAVYRAFSDPHFKFFKGALFSVVEKCGDCPICAKEIEKESEKKLDSVRDDIDARDSGYYFSTDKIDKQLTTFTIEPESFSTVENDDGTVRRTGINGYILWGDNKVKVRIDDESWNSRSNFVRAVAGIGNLAVYATDTEIQKIKHHLFSSEIEMEEVHEVVSCGIHWMQVGRAKTLVYVEPAFSITAAWEQGTHVLATDELQAPPNFFEVPGVEAVEQEELAQTLRNLMKVNEPYVVAQILGWTSACFIKQQIITRINQFPLLNLWGSAEAGKSKTANLFCYLHALDYEMRDSPLGLETATPYSIPAMVGSSTTVPRILDECNPTQIPRRVYDKFTGVCKAAWGGLSDSKGTLSSNGKAARVAQVKLTGPTIYLSEQPPERPALKTRSVMIGFTKRQRQQPGREKAFLSSFENRNLLSVFGKSMLERALHTLPRWCLDKMDHYAEQVPREVDVRAHYSYTVLLTGLDFFADTATSVGINLTKEIDELKRALISHLEEAKHEISKDKARSETDIVMSALSVLAAQPEDVDPKLTEGFHYSRYGDDLQLNLHLTFPQYGKYCRQVGERPVVRSPDMMKKLLQGETYFKNIVANPDKDGQELVVLSIGGLKAKGIPAGNFVEGEM